MSKAQERRPEGCRKEGDRRRAAAQAGFEQPAVGPVHASAVHLPVRAGGRPEQGEAEQGREGERHDPAQEERDGHDGEQRPAELADVARVEPYGAEGEDGYERRPEERPGGLVRDAGKRLLRGFALLHPDKAAVHDDDGVVHEHAQGEDERGQGYHLQVDAQGPHADEGAQDGQKQGRPDHQPRAQPHGQQQDGDDDAHGFRKVDHEVPDGAFHVVRLVVDGADLHARGERGAQLVQEAADVPAHGNDVAAFDGGYADADGRHPVEAHDLRGRLHVAAADIGYVAQVQHAAAAAPDVEVPDLFQPVYGAGNAQARVFVVHADGTGVGQGVAAFQGLEYLLLRYAQPGELRAVELHKDGLLLHAPEFDPGHVSDHEQTLLEEVRLGFQLIRAVALAVEGEEDAVHVAVVVAHAHAGDARRQPGADVGGLPAQFVPDLRQFA